MFKNAVEGGFLCLRNIMEIFLKSFWVCGLFFVLVWFFTLFTPKPTFKSGCRSLSAPLHARISGRTVCGQEWWGLVRSALRGWGFHSDRWQHRTALLCTRPCLHLRPTVKQPGSGAMTLKYFAAALRVFKSRLYLLRSERNFSKAQVEIKGTQASNS